MNLNLFLSDLLTIISILVTIVGFFITNKRIARITNITSKEEQTSGENGINQKVEGNNNQQAGGDINN